MSNKEGVSALDGSKCIDCIYMISRLIVPIDPDDFGFTQEEFAEMSEDAPVLVEQFTCAILNMDIVYHVVECNKHTKSKDNSLFANNNFLNV